MLNNSVIFDNHRLIIQNINCIYAKSLTSRSERYNRSISIFNRNPSPFNTIYSGHLQRHLQRHRNFFVYIFEAHLLKDNLF